MARWLIRKDSNVRQYWERLREKSRDEQAAFEIAERLLSENPHPFHHAPGLIKHLKHDWHCHHEYRNLPNAQRIFYKIWPREEITEALRQKRADAPQEPAWEDDEQKGLVVFFYAGPHPRKH